MLGIKYNLADAGLDVLRIMKLALLCNLSSTIHLPENDSTEKRLPDMYVQV